MSKKYLFLIICIFSITLLFGCSKNETNTSPRTYTHFSFDTVCNITIYGNKTDTEQNIINDIFKKMDYYDNLFDKYDKDSETSKMNNAKSYVVVNDDTLNIIKKSLYYSKISNGAFDITISPVTDLWDIKNRKTVPAENKIRDTLSFVNYKNIKIKDKQIKINKNCESIDLGGIAKGYVADKVKNILSKNGIKNAIINLGGNILTMGNNKGNSFVIGIQKPFADDVNDYSATIPVKDKSIVTSGIYERYFKQNGKIYHHILDPKTGYPVENNLLSVTIISDDSTTGDALSTTTFVLGQKKGMKLIDSLDNVYAVFITKDYKLHLSKGLSINKQNEISIK